MKKINKFTTQYMMIGMSFGAALGLLYGNAFGENLSLGMCIGLTIGMALGAAIGAEKDQRLASAMMTITHIDPIAGSADLLIRAKSQDGQTKEYRVTKAQQETELFAPGDRAAEVKGGKLVSLERK